MNNVKKLYKLQRKQLKKQYNEEVFKLYKARRDFAENKAFENREKVMQNQEFATVHYQIKNLNLDIAKAKFENDSTLLKKLQKQKKKSKDYMKNTPASKQFKMKHMA